MEAASWLSCTVARRATTALAWGGRLSAPTPNDSAQAPGGTGGSPPTRHGIASSGQEASTEPDACDRPWAEAGAQSSDGCTRSSLLLPLVISNPSVAAPAQHVRSDLVGAKGPAARTGGREPRMMMTDSAARPQGDCVDDDAAPAAGGAQAAAPTPPPGDGVPRRNAALAARGGHTATRCRTEGGLLRGWPPAPPNWPPRTGGLAASHLNASPTSARTPMADEGSVLTEEGGVQLQLLGQLAPARKRMSMRRIAAATATWPGVPFGIAGSTRIRADIRLLLMQLRGSAVGWEIPVAEVVSNVQPKAHAAAVDTPATYQRCPRRAAGRQSTHNEAPTTSSDAPDAVPASTHAAAPNLPAPPLTWRPARQYRWGGPARGPP